MKPLRKVVNLVKPSIDNTRKQEMYSLELWSDGAVSKNKNTTAIPSVGYACIAEVKNNSGETVYRSVYYGNITGPEETSQRGELTGAYVGITKLIKQAEADLNFKFKLVQIFSDSAYFINCFNGVNGGKPWPVNWVKRNWCASNKEPVKNLDIWIPLLSYIRNTYMILAKGNIFEDRGTNSKTAIDMIKASKASHYEITKFNHVPGHKGIELNELADHYARKAKEIEPNTAVYEQLIG